MLSCRLIYLSIEIIIKISFQGRRVWPTKAGGWGIKTACVLFKLTQLCGAMFID